MIGALGEDRIKERGLCRYGEEGDLLNQVVECRVDLFRGGVWSREISQTSQYTNIAGC